MKIYTNSKGESLPKVICAVVDFEKARLKDTDSRISLASTLVWNKSNIFGQDSQGNYNKWDSIYKGNYEDFYIVFPTCKNSRGQELPEDIQVEIVEERLRQWGEDLGQTTFVYKFNPYKSLKDSDYWYSVVISDYTPTELPTKSDDTFTQGEIVEERLRQGIDKYPRSIFEKGYSYWSDICHETDYTPTKSDDTFTQGEIVEVRDTELQDWSKVVYIGMYLGGYVCASEYCDGPEISQWKYIRKIKPLELTLPELLTIAESVKGTKVKLKV